MMKKDSLLAEHIEYEQTTIRDTITQLLGAEIFSLVNRLDDELKQLEFDEVSEAEFMTAVGEALFGIRSWREDVVEEV